SRWVVLVVSTVPWPWSNASVTTWQAATARRRSTATSRRPWRSTTRGARGRNERRLGWPQQDATLVGARHGRQTAPVAGHQRWPPSRAWGGWVGPVGLRRGPSPTSRAHRSH